MPAGRLRLAAIAAIITEILLGVFLGWVTPIFLNPFIKPDMVGGALFMSLFLVIIPVIGYFEPAGSDALIFPGNESSFSAGITIDI